MQWVTLTQEFTKVYKVNSVRRYGYNLGLDQFLDLKICGIDMDWVIEFLSTLDDNNIATITNRQGEKQQIILTPEFVSNALKLPNEGFVLGTWLSHRRTRKEILNRHLEKYSPMQISNTQTQN